VLAASAFAAGAMGPTVRAAWCAERTGNFAAIRSTTETEALLRGQAGTRVTVEAAVPTG
jgi:carbamate kinase